MKLTITGGLLEHLRDALDDVVEGNAPALAGMNLGKATLEIEERDPAVALVTQSRPWNLPDIALVSADRQDHARYRAREGQWERLHCCDWCGRGDWSEHAEWKCNCVVEPTRDDPEGWRE
jgi:hypothetical protein